MSARIKPLLWLALAVAGGLVSGATLSAVPIESIAMHAPTRVAASSGNGGIFWSADDGPGGLAQWSLNGGGGIFNSGTGTVTLSDRMSHNGHPALALTIRDANGQEQAARIFRWGENPEAAYYSAWFYFPEEYHPAQWWNVFQWKSKRDMSADASDPMWVLNVGNLPDGRMRFYLWDAIHGKSYDSQLVNPTKPLPVGCWTHVEAFYNRSERNTGQIYIWQDGVELYELDRVQTAVSDNVQWSLTNYTDRITPSTATIFVAGATISKSRLGPGNGPRC
jgi:hypothetical protein